MEDITVMYERILEEKMEEQAEELKKMDDREVNLRIGQLDPALTDYLFERMQEAYEKKEHEDDKEIKMEEDEEEDEKESTSSSSSLAPSLDTLLMDFAVSLVKQQCVLTS
jgi:hypothetical protein